MTRFRDCPPGGSWKTGDHCTRNVGRDQVTRPLTCYCTRTSVIEEGDRISARFTYNGTFSKAFMGYQPNGTADQMRSSDIGKATPLWVDQATLQPWSDRPSMIRCPRSRLDQQRRNVP